MLSKFHHHPSQSQQADHRSPKADGATIQVVRRPRGRPPGSKNKFKPQPLAVVPPSETTMAPYVLELPPGADIVDSAARFCRRRATGLCVLCGHGVVSDVTLRQPSSAATVAFRGRFDILSISATILPAGSPPLAGGGTFVLSLAGPQGQVVGGHVVGPLVAAGTIYLVAATFNNPSFHRLPAQADEEEDHGESPKAVSGGGDNPTTVESMYSYQGSDMVWGPSPTTRQPPGY